jgi:hypothetical protein
MARSSIGPNRAATWAVTQKPRPMPRVVRLGRPANDNQDRYGTVRRLLAFGLVPVVLGLVFVGLRSF